MAEIEITSTCDEGYATTSAIGEWDLTVDAAEEAGPNPNQVLAADYASCYIPAIRVAAQKEGLDDLGRIEVEVTADVDEDDDLEWIDFDIKTEGSLGEDPQAVVERGEDICHVHSALREALHAEISVEDEAL